MRKLAVVELQPHGANGARRRLLVTAFAILASTGTARAQKVHRVGWIVGPTQEASVRMRKMLTDRLASAGFTEGVNLELIERYAGGGVDRFPQLAREVARQNPEVVIAHGTLAVVAARAAGPMPIVFAFVGDPVGSGVVTDLAHPSGEITGYANLNYELIGKRLDLMHEAFPAARKIAVFHDPANLPEAAMLESLRKAAAAHRIELTVHRLSRPSDFDVVLSELDKRAPDGLFVLENIANVGNRARIVEFARRRRVPAMYGFDTFVEAGGLMSYGAPNEDQVVGAADYAARILRGTRVRDLPVRLPSRFELVVNLGEARRTGLAIPQSVLLRADRIVE